MKAALCDKIGAPGGPVTFRIGQAAVLGHAFSAEGALLVVMP